MFAFKLALAVGEFNVDAMLAQMPSSLLSEWMAFHNLDPFGYERADVGPAIVAKTIADANSKRRHKVSDFLPTFRRPGKAQPVGEMKRLFRAASRAWSESKDRRAKRKQ